MSGAVIEATDLTQVYSVPRGLFREPGKLQAVSAVSFRVEAGKTLAVVGESGCGEIDAGAHGDADRATRFRHTRH